ncbi:MAG: hypothetical protein WHT06_15745 [Desulfobacterales bacterium]
MKEKRERSFLPLLAVLVAAAIGVFLWLLLGPWQERRVQEARQQESRQWREQTEALTRRLGELEQQLQAAREETPAEGRLREVFGESAAPPPPGRPPAPEDIEARVLAFFRYLDGRDYVQAYQLEGGTYGEYLRALEALSAQPPRVTRETDSLYDLLRNTAYFYRVLGKKRIQLASEILRRETDVLESALEAFFAWFLYGPDRLRGRPEFSVLYDYASYLTETFGGRSYLLRREPRLRILLQYYSIQIFDRANDRQLNRNGIDIRPLIAATRAELRSHRGLLHARVYLAELERLARKYGG